MNTWRIVFAATVVTGCTASVDAPAGGTGANSGMGSPTGSGATGSGATGSGATGSGATGSGATGSGATGSGATGSGGASSGGSGAIGSGGTGSTSSCVPGVAPTSQIARLGNDEYDRTIRDLLGVTTLPSGSVPSNLLAADQAAGLTDIGWAAYKNVGDTIAAQVMADPTLKAKFITCDPAAAGCLHDTVVKFGRRAFRRPLEADEIARWDAVIAKGAEITPTGAPAEVAEALLSFFLISPSFLQHNETVETPDNAGHYLLSQHEIAARLSYMMWGSTPDAALDDAADKGMLGTPEQIKVQADRMVQDPKARDMVAAFHRYYMFMGLNTRWDNTNHDSTLFPAFKRELVPTLQQETELFLDSVVFAKNGTFQDLLLSPVAFVTAVTAPLYGLDASGFDGNWKETTLDANQRPGFLTRLGFLNAYSSYNRSNPILRGAFIAKQVLGVPIMSPPPGAEQTMLPPLTADINTNRKQVDAMTAGPDCKGCHHPYINPPGFAMEAFNAVGTWQTMENGVPIDTAADIMIDADGEPIAVKGPAELMAAIAAAPGAQYQYASKWVSYAYHREGNANDACTAQRLAAKMAPGGYKVTNLITDLAQADSFRVRAVEQ